MYLFPWFSKGSGLKLVANFSFFPPSFLPSFFSLGPHPWHLAVPRLGVELKLQLLANATATAIATQDPSCACDLQHNLRHCQILYPLSEARNGTTSSWIVVRFVTTEAQGELQDGRKLVTHPIMRWSLFPFLSHLNGSTAALTSGM